MTQPTLFEKMRANRRHWAESRPARINRLLEQLEDLERQETAEWHVSHLLDPDGSAPVRIVPPRRRLFGWLRP